MLKRGDSIFDEASGVQLDNYRALSHAPNGVMLVVWLKCSANC